MLIAAAALLVGVLLGLLGGGGGMVTVPTLIYGAGMGVKQSVAHAVPIVGLITLWQSMREIKAKRVRLKGTIAFAISSMIGTYLGARATSTLIPERELIFILTGTIMFAAVIMMRNAIKSSKKPTSILPEGSKLKAPLLVFIGLFTGIISGMVGVGGGFMMVPALSLIAGYPMTVAVGTNLVIIATKSIFGVIGYLNEVQWQPKIILFFLAGGILGSYTGAYLRSKASDRVLKFTFAIFLFVMSAYLIYDQAL